MIVRPISKLVVTGQKCGQPVKLNNINKSEFLSLDFVILAKKIEMDEEKNQSCEKLKKAKIDLRHPSLDGFRKLLLIFHQKFY